MQGAHNCLPQVGLRVRVTLYTTGKDLKRAQWNGYRVPQKNFRDTIRVPQLWGRRFGDTILGDTIVSLVVSLNVSPTVSLEGHDRVRHGMPPRGMAPPGTR